ncbi:FG-GAP repeat domain-containing protein [Tumebacillus lipolyticus]|uniref:FG-GAP repeat domain-containing protein n=1 Tax=Tumebacillus lipolyticus TaxID=1280370 RepID=A0ABW4ZUX1_9BACL
MEFVVMPDHLYGASVRINGKWLGAVEERPLSFQVRADGAFSLLFELMPLASDPAGDVTAVPFARLVKVKQGKIVSPVVEADGALHLRKVGAEHHVHFVYPKIEAIGEGLETLLMPLQTETADFDHDGRLDVAESFATNLRGHVRVRSASGKILLQEVYPDNALHIEAADLTKDGRPDLLIFWRGRGEEGIDEPYMQLWDGADGALSTHAGFTGIRRTGRGEVLVEKREQSPFRQVVQLFRYQRTPGESAQFQAVKREAKMLQRADDEAETLEAFLLAWEMRDSEGAELYLAKGSESAVLLGSLSPFYGHEIESIHSPRATVSVYEWIDPGFYDLEKKISFELVRQPDQVSEWKIRALT